MYFFNFYTALPFSSMECQLYHLNSHELCTFVLAIAVFFSNFIMMVQSLHIKAENYW